MPHDSATLPVETLRPRFLQAVAEGPVVVSSPTGSGKSTQVPRWCPGPVLVVEPRRVACRSLAQRVAELEGCALGEEVGYWVRDDRRVTEGARRTRITFATPGVALRIFQRIEDYGTVILDELHERTLDVDLLLALLEAQRRAGRSEPDPQATQSQSLVVMSATLEGERVAEYLGGRHLHAEGRLHPVEVRHLPQGTLLPDARGLESRVVTALRECRDLEGDVLVFLPGKAEIASCAAALDSQTKGAGRKTGEWEVLELHGGLSLARQGRVFQKEAHRRARRAILATNVAETSITVPNIGAVVDSGLVRRTRYHQGRGFLTRVPVAMDSAEQRAGRAGRTGPGVCFRLWDPAARLEARTPPEIHREALAALVLAAAACGAAASSLRFLDAPRDHALETAREELRALGALEGADGNGITERGRQLFGLPLDAPLGALLVEAEARSLGGGPERGPGRSPGRGPGRSPGRGPEGGEVGDRGILRDLVDLVSMLAPGRRIFRPGRKRHPDEPLLSPEEACDAVALLKGLRGGRSQPTAGREIEPGTLSEARAVRARLEEAFGLTERPEADAAIDRNGLPRRSWRRILGGPTSRVGGAGAPGLGWPGATVAPRSSWHGRAA